MENTFTVLIENPSIDCGTNTRHWHMSIWNVPMRYEFEYTHILKYFAVI